MARRFNRLKSKNRASQTAILSQHYHEWRQTPDKSAVFEIWLVGPIGLTGLKGAIMNDNNCPCRTCPKCNRQLFAAFGMACHSVQNNYCPYGYKEWRAELDALSSRIREKDRGYYECINMRQDRITRIKKKMREW